MIGSARLLLAFILALAGVIQGESEVILELAGPSVAAVAMNRAAIGKDLGGWHAWAEPSPRAIEMAWAAYRQGGDRDGPLNALSKSDIEKLGFDKSEWLEICSDDGRWCEYIGRWPSAN